MSSFLPRSNSNRSNSNTNNYETEQQNPDSAMNRQKSSGSSSAMSRENSTASTSSKSKQQQMQNLHHSPLPQNQRQKSGSSSHKNDNNDNSNDSSTSSSESDEDDSFYARYNRRQQQQQSSGNAHHNHNHADDPYRIYSRFVRQSKMHFRQALSEIQAGRKSSCWSWYFFPVQPWVVNGVERGSYTNQEYCLRDLPPNDKVGYEACRAYLQFPTTVDGVSLRQNYLAIISAVGDQLENGIKPVSLVGFLDEPKLRSSLKLFEKVSRGGYDTEVHHVVTRAMRGMKEEPME